MGIRGWRVKTVKSRTSKDRASKSRVRKVRLPQHKFRRLRIKGNGSKYSK